MSQLHPRRSGNRPYTGHRARNELDASAETGKADARHAYLWGVCERGPSETAPDAARPKRCSIDE